MKPLTEIACVSIAVPSIDEALPAYTDGLGLEITGERRESKRGFSMEWIELGAGGHTFLELIAPTGDDGPVAKFLSQEGTSHVYQVRFAVDDLDEALETLAQRGLDVIKGQDVPGDPRVGWVHPRSTGGVLFELVQFGLA